MFKPKIELNPYAIEKTTIYSTVIEFNGNRLELFEEWRKRFVNTEIVVLDMVDSGKWYISWTNPVYNNVEKGKFEEGL